METARERLKDLLIILLEAVSTPGGELGLDTQKFRQMVAEAGYDVADLGGILTWLKSQMNPRGTLGGAWPPLEEVVRSHGVRLFGEEERACLTPAAFGYLLELVLTGQISRSLMEALIHHASLVADLPLQRQELIQLIDQVCFQAHSRIHPGHAADDLESVH